MNTLEPPPPREPDEVYVTWHHAFAYPARRAPGWRWTWTFRPEVALRVARDVDAHNAATPDPQVQHYLVPAPDERTIAHITYHVSEVVGDAIQLEEVYELYDATGAPRRVALVADWSWWVVDD